MNAERESFKDTVKSRLSGGLKGDSVIWIIVLCLAVTSIVAVFSASSFLATARGISKIDCFFEQLKYVIAGLAFLFFCYLVPVQYYRKSSFVLFGIALILLVINQFIGVSLNGAVRGIKVGGHTIQVFEPAKVALVLYLARAVEVFRIDTFGDYCLKLLLPIVLVCGLIIMNSFSTALLVALLAILILTVIGIKPGYILATIGIGVVALGLLFGVYKSMDLSKPDSQKSGIEKVFNRFGTAEGRIKDFVSGTKIESGKETAEMTQEEIDERRQSENAKIAISEGGIFGKGPGKSTQRYSLSMAFSDFIYAFIVEEYGLLGGIFVMLLYLWFFFRCMIIANSCTVIYSETVVTGLSLLIVAQAMLHILVNVRLIPITGHTLPLISHGGSAYIVLCGAFGIILSINSSLESQGKIKPSKK
jgi:cell division protein FtsW